VERALEGLRRLARGYREEREAGAGRRPRSWHWWSPCWARISPMRAELRNEKRETALLELAMGLDGRMDEVILSDSDERARRTVEGW